MEKNEKAIATIFLVMAVLLFAPVVSAAALSATWNSPANYSNLSTSFTYNCTTSVHQATNVTVYRNSTAGAMTPLTSFANTSVAQTAWTGTVSITAAVDGVNQNLTCKAQNATVTAYSDQRTASRITLDSTNPACSVSVLKSNIAYKGLQTVTYSSSDALSLRTTTFTIDGPQKHETITLTDASATVNLASNDTKHIGTWTVSLSVADWAGNTCSDSATFKSYLPDDEEAEDGIPAQDYTIVWLIIIAVIAYFIFKKK